MRYVKCPHCELNYITQDQTICKVCSDKVAHLGTEEENETELCPICYRNPVDKDDLMCKKCFQKRNKKPIEQLQSNFTYDNIEP